MGPNRKSKKYQVKESPDTKAVVKNIIPVTSFTGKKTKVLVRKNGEITDHVIKQQIGLPTNHSDFDKKQQCLSLKLKPSVEKEDPCTKHNIDPSSSRELDSQMADKRDDSLCEGDDILDSQLSSQDNYLLESSQDDSQCDVRWDYTSPETMKQLKKMRGKYCVQDVKRIIANFPDLPIKPLPTSFHRIQFPLPPQNVDAVSEKNRILKAKQRAAKRWQQRERCKGAVEDMLLFLQQHQQKQENATASESPLEVSTEKEAPSDEKLNGNVNGLEDSWSDDDLFRDNSFLIEATQNVEKILPLIGKAPDKQSSDLNSALSNMASKVISGTSSDMFLSTLSSNSLSVANSTSVIPSSYAGNGKETFFPSAKTLFCDKNSDIKNNVSTFTNKMNYNYPTIKSSMKGGCATSTSNDHVNVPLTRTTSFGQKPNGLISRGVSNGPMNVKSVNIGKQNTVAQPNVSINSSQRSFRRHHTFQDNRNLCKPHTKDSSPALNSPFRRFLSFDDSHSSNSKTSSVGNNESSFDSSLTDELLLQATEDVDSLINQKTSATIGNDRSSYNCDPRPATSLPKPQYSSNSCISNKLNQGVNISNTLLSPVRPLNQNLSIKKVQANALNSPVQSFFKKSLGVDSHQAVKHKSQSGPSSSTPVKIAKSSDKMDNFNLTNKGSDSFMDDDSFMNDAAMFESQILPILEMAETQVTTKKSSESSSPAKYSPDEIEKKRQAALQKLMKNNPVMNDKPNTDVGTGDEKQSQIVCSPQKCSQDEIGRKKKAAQRKLLAKTNSTGSINFSQIGNAPSKPSSGDISPHKCSQEEIKMKREEALKKRRLRLQQAPNMKS